MHQDEKRTRDEVKTTGQLEMASEVRPNLLRDLACGRGGRSRKLGEPSSSGFIVLLLQTCCGTWLAGVGAEAASWASPAAVASLSCCRGGEDMVKAVSLVT